MEDVLDSLSREYSGNVGSAKRCFEKIYRTIELAGEGYVIEQLSFVQTIAERYKDIQIEVLRCLSCLYSSGFRDHETIAKQVDIFARLQRRMDVL